MSAVRQSRRLLTWRVTRRTPTRRLVVYVARRLLFIPAAVLIVVTFAFAIVNLMPGDPARLIGGDLVTEAQIHEIDVKLGLADSLGTRYGRYMSHLVRGDLGRSFHSDRPIRDEIWQHLPNTLELIILSLAFAVVLGLGVGGIGAYFADRWPDRCARLFIATTQSIPDFFLGLILIYVMFFVLRWVPAPVGQLGILEEAPPRVTGAIILDALIGGRWGIAGSAMYHAILPVLTLGLFYSAYFAKTTRAVLGKAIASDQVEFARACGLPERKVLLYALREARTTILTYGGILFAALIGGAAVVEVVFAWDGFGQWAINAILKLDIPEIQGFILVAGLFTLFVYLALDLLVAIFDPRVSYG